MTIELDKTTHDIIWTQVRNGSFASPEALVKRAIESFCEENARNQRLAYELEKGIRSGYIENLNKEEFIKNLHIKHQV